MRNTNFDVNTKKWEQSAGEEAAWRVIKAADVLGGGAAYDELLNLSSLHRWFQADRVRFQKRN